jgi:transcription elongation factor GreA
MSNLVPVTKEGMEKLTSELKHLKSVERPRIIEAIATARELGDLKENAEYHSAREQQSFIEGRIMELEGKLSHAQIIDVTQFTNSGKVVFGTTVTLERESDGQEFCYKIVGEDEANVKENKISITSPIARAIIGKLVDDVASVTTPNGEVVYVIVNVEYI